jgi:hypothetical protein
VLHHRAMKFSARPDTAELQRHAARILTTAVGVAVLFVLVAMLRACVRCGWRQPHEWYEPYPAGTTRPGHYWWKTMLKPTSPAAEMDSAWTCTAASSKGAAQFVMLKPTPFVVVETHAPLFQ